MNNYYYCGNNKYLLSMQLNKIFRQFKCVILCIGTDKVVGDCLGPLCGQMLTKVHNVNTYVYGTLSQPVNAKNIKEVTKFIREKHSDCKIIAIDSSLGLKENVGLIQFGKGSIATGSAIRKEIFSVGDYFLTAIINSGSFSDNSNLFSTRLHVVNEIAELISGAIAGAMQNEYLKVSHS